MSAEEKDAEEVMDGEYRMRRILLDAGHGGEDNGAQAQGVCENEIVLDVTLAVGKTLNHLLPKHDICYTRIMDKTKSLEYREKVISDLRPEAFISIHCNAIPDNPQTRYDDRKYAEGFEIFYRDPGDLLLAQKISRVMGRSDLWRRNRGIKQDQKWLGKRLAVLNSLDVSSVLIEIGFLTNDRERQMITNNVPGIADLIAHGIFDYIQNAGNNCNA